jgi:hypothetical protein
LQTVYAALPEIYYRDCIQKNNLKAFKDYLNQNKHLFANYDHKDSDICSRCIHYNRVRFIEFLLKHRLTFTFPLSLDCFFKQSIEMDRIASDHVYISRIEYTIQHNRYEMMKGASRFSISYLKYKLF